MSCKEDENGSYKTGRSMRGVGGVCEQASDTVKSVFWKINSGSSTRIHRSWRHPREKRREVLRARAKARIGDGIKAGRAVAC